MNCGENWLEPLAEVVSCFVGVFLGCWGAFFNSHCDQYASSLHLASERKDFFPSKLQVPIAPPHSSPPQGAGVTSLTQVVCSSTQKFYGGCRHHCHHLHHLSRPMGEGLWVPEAACDWLGTST